MKADFEKGTKICSRCKKELSVGMFTIDNSANDGLVAYCKKCCCELRKQYYEKNRRKMIEYHVNRQSTFCRKGHERGNSGFFKRDYELNEEQLKRRNNRRKRKNNKKRKAYGVMIWYSEKLNNLNSEDYRKEINKEYNRQRYCAMKGNLGKTIPSEHFLFDFDLELMLRDGVKDQNGNKMERWWKGNIRHWTVKDEIWKE